MKSEFSKKQKEKIYKELNTALYREINVNIDGLRQSLDKELQGLLDESFENAWEVGGAKELRDHIDKLMKILISSKKEKKKPKLTSNVKFVRFNKPFRPIGKRNIKVNKNQLNLEF